jgi:hypothetical protein
MQARDDNRYGEGIDNPLGTGLPVLKGDRSFYLLLARMNHVSKKSDNSANIV